MLAPNLRHEAIDRELTALYQNVPGIVFYVSVEPDGDFRFKSMSQSGFDAMGLARDKVVNCLVRDVIPPPSRDLVLNNYREAIRSGQTVRWREVSVYPTGEKVGEVAVTPIYDSDGIATHLIGTVYDVTERDRSEELSRKRQEDEHNRALKTLLETATQGIVSVEANGSIVTANHALEAMFGWSRDEMIGRPLEMLMPSGLRDSHRQHRANYFTSPVPRLMGAALNLVAERRDGTRFPVEVTLNHVSSPHGELAFAFITDVSERKEAEETLSKVPEKLMRAQDQEAARIARELHDDIGQRLGLLAMELDTATQSPPKTAQQIRTLLKHVRGEVDELISDLHSISHHLHPSSLEYLGIVPAIRSFCLVHSANQNLEITFEGGAIPDPVPQDVALCLFRVMQEAVHNAVKHGHARNIEVTLTSSDHQLQLTVSDLGSGFNVENALKGKGLGLISMRERVRMVGGDIRFVSRPNMGTTVAVRVPLAISCDAGAA